MVSFLNLKCKPSRNLRKSRFAVEPPQPRRPPADSRSAPPRPSPAQAAPFPPGPLRPHTHLREPGDGGHGAAPRQQQGKARGGTAGADHGGAARSGAAKDGACGAAALLEASTHVGCGGERSPQDPRRGLPSRSPAPTARFQDAASGPTPA